MLVLQLYTKNFMKKTLLTFVVLSILSCEVIFVEDISSSRVVILAPSQDSSVSPGDISFLWELLDDADAYKVQVATPSFENASQILLDSIVDVNQVRKNLESVSINGGLRQ